MNFNSVSQELRKYLLSKGFLAFALPFANILIFACIILRAVTLIVSIDAIITTIVLYAFYFSIVLLLAKEDYLSLAIGLGGNCAVIVVRTLKTILMTSDHFLSFSSIIDIAIYALLAFIAFKKYKTYIRNSRQ